MSLFGIVMEMASHWADLGAGSQGSTRRRRSRGAQSRGGTVLTRAQRPIMLRSSAPRSTRREASGGVIRL